MGRQAKDQDQDRHRATKQAVTCKEVGVSWNFGCRGR